MVSSGPRFQRGIPRVLLALFCFGFVRLLPAAELSQVAGTMPEDYLPELKEILGVALQRSPDVIAKEFDRLLQEARVIQVRAQRLPQLGGNFSYGITETSTASDTNSKTRDSGFFYNFNLSQAVFHWGALKKQSEGARLSLLATEKGFAIACREVSVVLRKLYLSLIVEKARLRQTRDALRLAVKDLEIADVRKAAGLISAGALEGQRLGLRESTLEVDRVEAEFDANRRRFARIAGMGLPDLPVERIPNDIPRPVYSEARTTAIAATLLRQNASSTLEYEVYDLKVREAVLRQQIEATRLLPKIGTGASYSLENNTNVNGNLAEQRAVARQSISIGGSWTIFDGLATRGVRREALAARRAAEQLKTTEIEKMLQSAQRLERTIRLNAEQLDLVEIRRSLAIEGRNRTSTEVGFGNLPRGDIERAETSVLQAQAASLSVRAAFLADWSEFVALASEDPVLDNLPLRYGRAKK